MGRKGKDEPNSENRKEKNKRLDITSYALKEPGGLTILSSCQQ